MRPSRGAATSAIQFSWNKRNTFSPSLIAVAEDGHTPHFEDTSADTPFVLFVPLRGKKLTTERRRIGHIALVEIHVMLREIGGVHHRASFAEIQIDVQFKFLR